ncbi:hypothetical protein TNCT_499631 [Trichonephila clavata]|uniref:Uncharacterized protein n=1 Tax=Trichonephila clavata TaxID=2740835 RepID=A0A8X6IBY5_TRICU|nr:hypothetical protein TNCT_499631 [Trichonephila clavata]
MTCLFTHLHPRAPISFFILSQVGSCLRVADSTLLFHPFAKEKKFCCITWARHSKRHRLTFLSSLIKLERKDGKESCLNVRLLWDDLPSSAQTS